MRFDKTTGTITGFDSTVTEALIPEEIDGVTVTAIADWVGNRTMHELTVLTLPSTITSIGQGVFRETAIEELVIPGSIGL
ncbi:MAG: hypothetical protein IKT17_10860, partial [Lachnospiraceae bacterium]|nr:hypothetical protein [Lachnospiraceae bacterium]